MTSEPSRGGSTPRRGWPSVLSWFRIGKYIRNILLFEQTVEGLKQQNKELDQRISVLQRQLDEQTGQLKVLLDFVNKALEERIDSRVEDAVKRSRVKTRSHPSPKRRKRRRQEGEI